MDWSSLTKYRGELAIVVGFALLLNPLVVGVYDIGDPDRYRYEPSEVEFYSNGTYRFTVPALPLDPDVGCLGDVSRSCVLERAIHANGGITYDTSTLSLRREYVYVHVWGQGFFRPTKENSENGTARYGLDPVPQEEALEHVTTPLSEVSTGVETAITQGHYETRDELPGAHELVRTKDRYYVVYPTTTHVNHLSERTDTVVALQWILGIAGAGLVLRGQRIRVERR